MSTSSPFVEDSEPVRTFEAPGFPGPRHPAEADLFSRQSAMVGHDQAALEAAHVCVVGCGGLGGVTAFGIARMGVRRLTLMDDDVFDRSNAPRQFVTAPLLGQNKAHALAAQLVDHMTSAGQIISVAARFDDALPQVADRPSAIVVGVDNNLARLKASTYGRSYAIPVVFSMLSLDGLRAQAFLQLPDGPCLSCVLPDLDSQNSAPCAAASIASCFLATSHAIALLAAAIMSSATLLPHWRETSLDGSTERALMPSRRSGCRCNA